MDASLIPAIQIDETVTARRRTAEYSLHEYSVKVTRDCPCSGCPYQEMCRDDELACEKFVCWTRGKQPFWNERIPSAAQIPSEVLYRKYVA